MNNKDSNQNKSLNIDKLSHKDRLNEKNVTEEEKQKVDEYFYVIETMASILYSKKKVTANSGL